MNRTYLPIIKEQIKNSRICLDRAAWFLKIPTGHNLHDGLKKLAAVEALKAIRELAQAAAILLDDEQAVLFDVKTPGLCVNEKSQKSNPVLLKDILPGLMQDIENRIRQNRGKNEL